MNEEVQRVDGELAGYGKVYVEAKHYDRLEEKYRLVCEERDRLKPNAERYEWLREREAEKGIAVVYIGGWERPATAWVTTLGDPQQLDGAVDEARRREREDWTPPEDAVLFDPYTGQQRARKEIRDDPYGHHIARPFATLQSVANGEPAGKPELPYRSLEGGESVFTGLRSFDLKEVDISTYTIPGQGGWNPSPKQGAKVIHLPTGLTFTSEGERSVHANVNAALSQLKEELSERVLRGEPIEAPSDPYIFIATSMFGVEAKAVTEDMRKAAKSAMAMLRYGITEDAFMRATKGASGGDEKDKTTHGESGEPAPHS